MEDNVIRIFTTVLPNGNRVTSVFPSTPKISITLAGHGPMVEHSIRQAFASLNARKPRHPFKGSGAK